jgi:stringent starvation protein B
MIQRSSQISSQLQTPLAELLARFARHNSYGYVFSQKPAISSHHWGFRMSEEI